MNILMYVTMIIIQHSTITSTMTTTTSSKYNNDNNDYTVSIHVAKSAKISYRDGSFGCCGAPNVT